MKLEQFSVTFWFDIYDDFNVLLEGLKDGLKEEFNSFNYNNVESNDLLIPVISSFNNEKKTNVHVTRISSQYNMDNVTMNNMEEFTKKAINLFELLINNGVEILYSSVTARKEQETDEALSIMNKQILSSNYDNIDLVEASVKLAMKIDDQFYKVITLNNNKQIKIEKQKDKKGRDKPIFLTSLNGSFVEKEAIMIDYEINDRYLYDFTKNYSTTEFHLNKMLYLIKEDFEKDINDLIETGKIN